MYHGLLYLEPDDLPPRRPQTKEHCQLPLGESFRLKFKKDFISEFHLFLWSIQIADQRFEESREIETCEMSDQRLKFQ